MTSRTSTAATHELPLQDRPWSQYIVHPPERSDSPWFTSAKRTAHKILAEPGPDGYPYGPGPWGMHHGGSNRVRLVYARHGTPEGDAVALAQEEDKAVILPPG